MEESLFCADFGVNFDFRIQVVFYAENRKRRIRNLFLGCEHVFENMVHVAAQHNIRSAEIIG